MSIRASGVIIHPTAFPGKYGCGDLGQGAYEIIDWLKNSGQKILQVLPIGPTGFGDSPYQSFSCFAGNPYFISFDNLIDDGLLAKKDMEDYPVNKDRVDYFNLYNNNFKILYNAYLKFKNSTEKRHYIAFCETENDWLDDYSLFMAVKEINNGVSWNNWSNDLIDKKNLKVKPALINDKIDFYKFIQWIFYKQWNEFKKYAVKNDIFIIGDLPIFVSLDSADVWANKKFFSLDENNNPVSVAGVPPDYFSKTGQLWGNPVYNWEEHEKNNFSWWIKRVKHVLKLVDVIRIDHFRGFESYWEIPFGEKTAINGRWVKAPGQKLFKTLKDEFGDKIKELIIAEDLGVITPEVKELRDFFSFPGMRIFEFANFPEVRKSLKKENILKASEDSYLPHNYIENCVAYPGTHDNDTLKGWFDSLDKQKQKDVLVYLKINDKNRLNETVIKTILDSKADRVIFLIQDVLGLGSGHRYNLPGTSGGHNWRWRLKAELLTEKISHEFYNLTKNSGRI